MLKVLIVGTIGSILLMAALGASTGWADWAPATCLPDACFCEADGAGWVRQPINTWSNLAFVVVGLLIAADGAGPRRGARGTLAVAAVLIGLGSLFYHASLTFVGQWFDVMSMYLLGTFMVLYAAARLKVDVSFRARRGLSEPDRQPGSLLTRFFAAARLRMTQTSRLFVSGYIALNVVLGVLLIVWPEARRYLFGLLIAAALVLETILQRRHLTTAQPRWLAAALGVYVTAQIIWTLDLNHVLCDPTSVLQGHAVWHVLTALAAGLLYGYYRSEGRGPIGLAATAETTG